MANDSIEINNKNKEEEVFDTTGLLLSYLANWKWFLLSVIICLILGGLYIASRTPLYQVKASIYLKVDQEENPFSMGSSDAMISTKRMIDETELEIMKSKNNLLKIVDSLNLAYSYYNDGVLRNPPIYKKNPIEAVLDSGSLRILDAPIEIKVEPLGGDKYNISAKTSFKKEKEKKEYENVTLPAKVRLSQATVTITRVPEIEEFDNTVIAVVNNPLEVAKRLSKDIKIEFAEKSDKIIRISYDANKIEKGVNIINALIDFYNADIIADKNRSAIQTEAFIIERLVNISDELKDVETRLQEYRQAHNVTNITAQSNLNLNLQSRYIKEQNDIEAEIQIIQEIEKVVSQADIYQTLPAALENSTITKIIEDYNRKVSQYNRVSQSSTLDNPLVVNLRSDLERDKERILQNLATAKQGLITQRNSINALARQSTSELISTPTIDKGLQEIFREQQVKVNIYTFLLQRREEIALQKTLATNTARLIDDPQSEDKPVSPRKLIILAVAFLLGLAAPAALILVRRLLFPIFSDQEELRRLTKVPVIGEICQLEKGQENANIVVGENVATPVAELFRLLRNNISFTRSGAESKVILLTSSISGEGKTFVSANLAMTYALMGKKTLVIGMDLRRPFLARRFGFDNHLGVTTYLSGQETDINKLVIQSKENPNLYILPAGPVPPNPNELLMSPNMAKLMQELRNSFDYVIIDSAPIGVISDSLIILRYSDLQIYVTRAKYSTKSSLNILHQAIDDGKFSAVYLVINGVDIASNSYVYRRYGEYGRYGRYGSYSRRSGVYGYGYVSKDKSSKEE
ncbi:MAG: polysaccharide biosynthesis tyrosine autokinase [Muribaculaceae bacterium]|nr:polysaccharide biosynthesis tyrosine autokinase [Muribaculaceae bacterium]